MEEKAKITMILKNFEINYFQSKENFITASIKSNLNLLLSCRLAPNKLSIKLLNSVFGLFFVHVPENKIKVKMGDFLDGLNYNNFMILPFLWPFCKIIRFSPK